MATRIGGWSPLTILAGLLCGVASAEGGAEAIDAYLTIASGEQVYRRSPDVPKPSQIGAIFSTENNRISPGESVRTGATSAAMLIIPGYEVVIYLEPSSELGLVEPPTAERGVGVHVVVFSGRATVVRGTSAARWMVISGAPEVPAVAAFALTRNATMRVEVRRDSVSFTGVKEKAWHGVGALPDRALLDPSGEPVAVGLSPIGEGQQVVTPMPAVAIPPGARGVLLLPEGSRVVSEFARSQSVAWVVSAEQGDFTPMRTAGRESPGLLQPSELVLTYDQARPGTPRTPARTGFAVVQAARNPAQTLAESSFPGTAVAASRFLSARVVGSSASGALTFNRFARLPFVLAGH
jgi:hypothetical protein